MSQSLKPALKAAVLRMIGPLASLLLDAGLGIGDLNAMAKVALVRAAQRQASGSGRSSVSRLAVLTGLTRAEVKKILADADPDTTSDRGKQRAERVLAGWWHDPEYQDARGEPVLLPLRGKRRSFIALVERYGGEAVLSAPILDALIRVNAVRRRADGRLQVLTRTYANVRWNTDGIEAMGEQVAEFLETLIHNLRSPADARFVGRALNARIDPRYIPVLMRDIREQAEGLVEGADHQLNAPVHTVRGKSASTGSQALGIGVYLFRGDATEEESNTKPRKKPRVSNSRVRAR